MAKVGQVLTVITTVWAVVILLTYQWLRNLVAISGAIERAYTLTPDYLSRKVTVSVIVKKTGNAVATKSSASTVAVAPVVSGTPTVSQKLSVSRVLVGCS